MHQAYKARATGERREGDPIREVTHPVVSSREHGLGTDALGSRCTALVDMYQTTGRVR